MSLTLHAPSAPRRSAGLRARSLPRARRQGLSREESQGWQPCGPDLDSEPASFPAPRPQRPKRRPPSYSLSLTPILPARDPRLSRPPDHSRRRRHRRVRMRAAFELLTSCQVPSDERKENKYFFPHGQWSFWFPKQKERGARDSKSGGGEGQARIFPCTPQRSPKMRVAVKVAI